jgi:Ca-activated chloride channel family protein
MPDIRPERVPETAGGRAQWPIACTSRRETGGKDFPVDTLDELPGICARIGAELREQYLVGYSPTNTALDGKYRPVSVVVRAPGGSATTVRHRTGYYAPLN